MAIISIGLDRDNFFKVTVDTKERKKISFSKFVLHLGALDRCNCTTTGCTTTGCTTG